MDMFTDVDILHDVLTAAMRNVAVYILLDEQNVDHFVNMVSNCRVNLQAFPVSEPLRAFNRSSFFVLFFVLERLNKVRRRHFLISHIFLTPIFTLSVM